MKLTVRQSTIVEYVRTNPGKSIAEVTRGCFTGWVSPAILSHYRKSVSYLRKRGLITATRGKNNRRLLWNVK